MQPRSLDQILTELDSTYNPQINSIRRQQADLPGQQAAEEQGLQAKQTAAFDDITNGARRRGLGFSGIPLGEQAKYTATEYLPAVARLKTAAKQQAMSLEDAINQIYEKRNTMGQGIYQNEQAAAEQRRQFDASMAFQREQAASAAKAASAFNPSYGAAAKPAAAAPKTDPIQQDAYNDVATRLSQMSPAQIKSDYAATAKSAGFGNVRDKYKLEFYARLAPQIFNGQVSINAFGNGGQVRF
jgi:hypothetical protein